MRRLALVSALVLAAACGGGHDPVGAGGNGTTAGPADAQTFTMHGNDRDQFVPQTLHARVGRLTLTLSNGGVPHDLVFKDGSLPGISAVSGDAVKSTTLTFRASGIYVFVCTIHPGMDGKVVVSR